MSAQHRSIGQNILHWSVIFVALGVIFFVLGCGGGLALDDFGLSGNGFVQAVVFVLMWPPFLLYSAFGWFSTDSGASTVSNSNLLGPLFSQLLGWGLLGVPIGLWRAKRRSSRAGSAI